VNHIVYKITVGGTSAKSNIPWNKYYKNWTLVYGYINIIDVVGYFKKWESKTSQYIILLLFIVSQVLVIIIYTYYNMCVVCQYYIRIQSRYVYYLDMKVLIAYWRIEWNWTSEMTRDLWRFLSYDKKLDKLPNTAIIDR